MTTNTASKPRRNAATGTWRLVNEFFPNGVRVTLEAADMIDRQTNHTYSDGAYRVSIDGKPVRGKGGSVPFLGESAWSSGDRLFHDTCNKIRFAR